MTFVSGFKPSEYRVFTSSLAIKEKPNFQFFLLIFTSSESQDSRGEMWDGSSSNNMGDRFNKMRRNLEVETVRLTEPQVRVQGYQGDRKVAGREKRAID